MSNIYGRQNLDGYMLDRYNVSNLRQNETPIEKVCLVDLFLILII